MEDRRALFPPRVSMDEKRGSPSPERRAGRSDANKNRKSYIAKPVVAEPMEEEAKPADEEEEKPLALTEAGAQQRTRMSVFVGAHTSVIQPPIAQPAEPTPVSKRANGRPALKIDPSTPVQGNKQMTLSPIRASPEAVSESEGEDSIMDGRQMLGRDYAESTTSSTNSDFVSPKVLLGSHHHRNSLVPSLKSKNSTLSLDEQSDSEISLGGDTITLEEGSSDMESSSDIGSFSSLPNAPLEERMQQMRHRAKKTKSLTQSFTASRFIVDNVQYLPKPQQKAYCELAIKQLKKLSINGMVEAQYLLANLYISGIPGFEEKHKADYGKAFGLYASAARQNHAEALFHVGLCYEQGAGVGKSYKRALHSYRKAAVK